MTETDFERKNEIMPEFAAIHALNPDIMHDAPARGTMSSSHFAQRPVILGSEPSLTQSIQNELGKYTFGVRMPEDGTILHILPRFQKSAGGGVDTKGIQTDSYVFYRSQKTGEVGYFVLPYYMSHHPYFGYRLEYKEAARKIHPMAEIPEGTVFADTPANKGNHTYTYSANLNLAIMPHPHVGLDGYVIRRGALDKFRFRVYETRSAHFGSSSFLINLHGTEDHYKPFPEIGDKVRPDGLLMVLRKFDARMAPALLSRKDCMTINHLFDRKIYSRAGDGTVVDIEVTRTGNVNKELPPEMMESLERYADAKERFYSEIVKFEESLISESKRNGMGGEINVTTGLLSLFAKAKGEINYPVRIFKDGRPIGKRVMPLTVREKTEDLDGWHIKITVEYTITPSRGFKASCIHGGKGVICRIEDDDKMPRDKDGNVADIISGQDSIPGRMNLGRLIEPYFNAAARDVRRHILETVGLGRYTTYVSKEQFLSLPKEKLDWFAQEYLDFYRIVSPEMAKEYEEYLTPDERIDWLLSYINEGPYIFRMTNRPVDAVSPDGRIVNFTDEKVEEIEKRWKLVYDTVTYKTDDGREVETLNKVRIMPISIMLLDKIADQWLAVDSGKLSIFGFLAPRNDGDKHSVPYRRTAPRTVGETEGSLYTLYGGRTMIAETLDRNGSLETQLEMARNLFAAEKPTNINRIVDREKIPLGDYRPIQITRHIFEVAGAEFGYVPERFSEDS